jgi:tetratricopeptide (TPR) repeat protein
MPRHVRPRRICSHPISLRNILALGGFLLAFAFACTLGAQAPALHTDPINLDPQIKQSMQDFYNLDYDAALKLQEQVAQQHPNNPMAWDYVLTTLVFRELYHQDLLDTTYYAHDSFLTTKRQVDVPAATRARIEDLTNRAIHLCDAELKANPNDANAYFARGYAKGIHASYITLVDHSFASAARQGYSARNDSESALKIDPQYADARMAIGIQQFAVASLPRWVRLIVGFMGVGGNKQQGLDNIKQAIAHGVVTPVEARTVLSLFLRHDGRYPEALAVQRGLADQYPHDFLFRLEVANLLKDEGHGLEAIEAYKQVIADAQKPEAHGAPYFVDPRLQLAWFGMADTQRGYNDIKSAAFGYTQAASQPDCSDWLRKRAQLNAGQMYDLLHDRSEAVHMYKLVLAPGGDQSQSDKARQYLSTPFSGK